MSEPASHLLQDLLLVREPVIAVIDHDRRRAAEFVRRACRDLGRSIGDTVEWTLTHGWRGPDNLMSTSGLTSYAQGGARKLDMPESLGQLFSWCAVTGDRLKDFPFLRGTAVVHDGDTFLEAPVLRRMLEDAPGALEPVEVSLILVLGTELGPTHPLRGTVASVRPAASLEEQYGSAASRLLKSCHGQWPQATAAEVARELEGLTQVEAAAVARLTVLESVRMAEGEQVPLHLLVRRARESYTSGNSPR